MNAEGIVESPAISRALCEQAAKPSVSSPEETWASLSNLCVSPGRTGPGPEGSRALDFWGLCLKACLVGRHTC